MKKFGIITHPKKKKSVALGVEMISFLELRGLVWMTDEWDGEFAQKEITDTDLLVVLGGDGSILRAASLSAKQNVPIFGVNLGRVGFLSEAEPSEWKTKLNKVLDNKFRIEKRLMLDATLWRDGKKIDCLTALNEIVVGRGSQARVLNFELSVGDVPVTHYIADGMIAATPTGSTAYASAVGGPILPPELPNFLVVPVAPHWSLERAIVLHRDATAVLTVTFDHEATMTADGRDHLPLESGDEIRITQSAATCSFVRTENESYFYNRLMERHVGA